MNLLKPIASAALLAISMAVNAAEKPAKTAMRVLNHQFLTYSAQQQHWWFKGAFAQLAHTIGMKDAKKAACILVWYETQTQAQEDLLRQYFAKYPNNAPTSVILSLMKKHCGLNGR